VLVWLPGIMGSGAGRKTKAKHTTAASVKTAPSEAPPWANRGLVVVMVAGVAAAVAYTRMINPTNTQDPRKPVPVGAPSPEEGIRYLDPVPHTVRSINITVPSYTHQEGWGVHRVELLAVDDFLPLALGERWRDSLAEGYTNRTLRFLRSPFTNNVHVTPRRRTRCIAMQCTCTQCLLS
jgi:hypothetical protein